MMQPIEKQGFSITIVRAIPIILFVIGATYSIVQMKSDLEAKTNECKTGMAHIVEELGKHDLRISVTESASNEIKIKLAGIEVQLANVNASLVEIKQYFKIK